MPDFDLSRPTRTKITRVVLWSTSLVLLVSLSWACLRGQVEHNVSAQQISGTGLVGSVSLPSLIRFGPGSLRLELFEEGRRLGPELEDPETVREVLGGSYAVRREPGEGLRPTRVYFSATDRSRPHVNGRLYTIRYPRRQLPAAIALLLGSWIVLPAVALRFLRMSADSTDHERLPLDAIAWSFVVIGILFSLFSIQAWLPLSNGAWFMALVGVGLPPFLARISQRKLRLPIWSPWLGGLLAWVALTALADSSYASPATATAFFGASAGGLVIYFGFGGALEGLAERRSSLLLGVFIAAASLSLARDAGFDLSGALASLGLTSIYSGRLVNPWTTKFVGHWLLVVAWCTVAALGWDRRRFRWGFPAVLSLAAVAIGVNRSIAALVALVISLAVAMLALRWGRAVRRVVIYGLTAAVLVAPLLAALPWEAQQELSGRVSEQTRNALDLDGRGGKWEFSRRFIEIRPLQGWGLGASGRLPGRELPIEEALGLEPGGPSSPSSSYPALAGGHPHNVALLTWLDLGLVGALLLAGLLVATGKSIGALEQHRRIHAALIGLLATTAIYLLLNYPVWEPEVASILWMSVALPSAVLPPPAESRRWLWRSGVAVLVILSIGCAFLAHERLSRWWTVRELRTSAVSLDRSAGRLTVGDEVRALRYDAGLGAGAKLVGRDREGPAVIQGWAFGPPGAESPEPVLVFVGPDLVGALWPERPSLEVFGRVERKTVRALTAGFEVSVEPERLDLGAPVTVVVLEPGRALAVELPPLSGPTA